MTVKEFRLLVDALADAGMTRPRNRHWKPNWQRPIPWTRMWDKRRARRRARLLAGCAHTEQERAGYLRQARNG